MTVDSMQRGFAMILKLLSPIMLALVFGSFVAAQADTVLPRFKKGHYETAWLTQPTLFYYFYALTELEMCADKVATHVNNFDSKRLEATQLVNFVVGEQLKYDPQSVHQVYWREGDYQQIDGPEGDAIMSLTSDLKVENILGVGSILFLKLSSNYKVDEVLNMSSDQSDNQEEILKELYITDEYYRSHYEDAVCYTGFPYY